MEKELKVEKIKKPYVSCDCVQVIIPFSGAITLLNNEEIVFYNDIDKSNSVNKYLSDDRRRKFPNSDVSIYRDGLLKRKNCSKQLLDYDKPYISIQNGKILERFVVKDKDEALLVSKILGFDKKTINMNYKQLLSFIFDNNDYDRVYYVYLDGTIPNDNRLFPTENEIYGEIISQLREKMENFQNYQKGIEHYSEVDRWFCDYVNECIENIDLSLVNFNIDIGKSLIVIRVQDNDIKIMVIEATLINYDNFKVNVYDMPVNLYTVDQVKSLLNVNYIRDSRIPFVFNNNIFSIGLGKRKILKK